MSRQIVMLRVVLTGSAMLLLSLFTLRSALPAPAQSPLDSVDSGTLYLPYVVGHRSQEPPPPPPDDSYATRVVTVVNQERAEAGCGPLLIDSRLVNAATGHSLDMATNDFFSHIGSDGSSPWGRMLAAGYTYSRAGENIAAGYSTPEQVVAGWMNSPGHRSNILNCAFTETGVGYIFLADDRGAVNYHHYWTHVFAAPG